MKLKLLMAIATLPLLHACSNEPVEFQYTNLSNNTFYLKKTGKPFSGQVKNVPYSSIASPEMNIVINSYTSFNVYPQNPDADLKGNFFTESNLIQCHVETKDGLLSGKTECQFDSSSLKDYSVSKVYIHANYNKGQLENVTLDKDINGNPTKILYSTFKKNPYTVDLSIFSVANPSQVLFKLDTNGSQSVRKFYSPKGTLWRELFLTDNQRDKTNYYDPKTKELIGSVTEGTEQIRFPKDGYLISYEIGEDGQTPDAKITSVKFLQDALDIYSQTYAENQFFSKAQFDQAMAQKIKERNEMERRYNERIEAERLEILNPLGSPPDNSYYEYASQPE